MNQNNYNMNKNINYHNYNQNALNKAPQNNDNNSFVIRESVFHNFNLNNNQPKIKEEGYSNSEGIYSYPNNQKFNIESSFHYGHIFSGNNNIKNNDNYNNYQKNQQPLDFNQNNNNFFYSQKVQNPNNNSNQQYDKSIHSQQIKINEFKNPFYNLENQNNNINNQNQINNIIQNPNQNNINQQNLSDAGEKLNEQNKENEIIIESENMNQPQNTTLREKKTSKVISKDGKSVIIVPSFSQIIPKDYNMNKDINKDINKEEKINEEENKIDKIDEQKDPFEQVEENCTIVKSREKKDEINNDKNIDKTKEINNSIKDDNNEKSQIFVPGLTKIVRKDFNLEMSKNNESKNNESKDNSKENIVDSIVFSKKINDSSEQNNSISNADSSQSNSFINVPGLSQIIKKDYNLRNNNSKIGEKNKNSISISITDIADSVKDDYHIIQNDNKEENNNKNNDKNKSENTEIIFNLMNKSNDNNNTTDIKNSFCLLRNETGSFNTSNNSSTNNNEIIDDILPSNIHNHPIIKSPLSEEICSLCLNKKTCPGKKCSECSLIICESCCKLIISNYILLYKHHHSLVLIQSNFKCNNCQKSGQLQNNFHFCCEKCNFGLCPQCYFS